jgi:hypothetical protein
MRAESEQKSSADRYLSVLFADDVRQEIDGKITIVGIYQSKMIFHELPAVIPKLAVVMTAVTPRSKPFSKLEFVLTRDDEVIQKLDISQDMIEQSRTDSEDRSPMTSGTVEYQFAAILGPLNIDAPCLFRGKAITESGEILGRSLEVMVNQSSST